MKRSEVNVGRRCGVESWFFFILRWEIYLYVDGMSSMKFRREGKN